MKRTDIARMYFPDLKTKSAVRKLNMWIRRCPELYERLHANGAQFDFKQELTIKEFLLIKEYLGDP